MGSMSLADNKALVGRFYEAISAGGDLVVLDEICIPSYVHGVGDGQNLAWLKAVVTEFRSGFPDVEFRVTDLLAEGEQVWARWTLLGTHLGTFHGIPPTGKSIEINDNFNLFCVAHGQLVEDTVCWGNGYRQLLAQLGVALPET
jgi:predicted ester cyclase